MGGLQGWGACTVSPAPLPSHSPPPLTCRPLPRSLGALAGIAATLLFPPLHRALGLVPTGACAIWVQLACVLAATAPSLLGAPRAVAKYALVRGGRRGRRATPHCTGPGEVVDGRANNMQAAGAPFPPPRSLHPTPPDTRVQVGGLVLSRLGLWGYDLAANQLIQETADPSALGVLSGAQGALQSAFQLLAYAAGVALPQPQRFPLLMAGSCASVGAAAALYTTFALRGGGGGGGGAPTPLRAAQREEEGLDAP